MRVSERVSGRARRAVGLLLVVAVLLMLILVWSLNRTGKALILSFGEVGLSSRVVS